MRKIKTYEGEIIRMDAGTEEKYYTEKYVELCDMIKKLGDYDQITILVKVRESE